MIERFKNEQQYFIYLKYKFVQNSRRKTGNTKINRLTNKEIMLKWDEGTSNNHIMKT